MNLGNGPDARDMATRFLSTYDGDLGSFSLSEDSDESSASVSCPDGDNISTIRFEISSNADDDFANRKSFIQSKKKRLGPMGKLEEFDCHCGFDESFGGILNFKLLGKVGGFFFFAGRKDATVVFMQIYSTNAGKQIPEDERDGIIGTVFRSI